MNPEYNYYPLTLAIAQSSSEPQTNSRPVVLADTNVVPSANGTIMSGGTLQSPNYSEGLSGWKINSDGTVEFVGFTIIRTFTAGEAITAKDAVRVADGSLYSEVLTQGTDSSANGHFGHTAAYHTMAAKFQLSTVETIGKIQLELRKVGAPTDNITVQIETDNAGVPSGTRVGNQVTKAGGDLTTDFAGYDLTGFAATLSAATNYWLVMGRSTAVDAVNYYRTHFRTSDVAFGTFTASGHATAALSWTIDGDITDGEANTYEEPWAKLHASETAGYIYRTKATTTGYSNYFIGFAPSAIARNISGKVVIEGIMTGLSSLTTGGFYFLSDTLGAISTTHGTVARQVGIAVSSTELLITNIWIHT